MEQILSVREEEAVNRVKKYLRMEDYDFQKDEGIDGISIMVGADTVMMEQDSRKKIVKFRLN